MHSFSSKNATLIPTLIQSAGISKIHYERDLKEAHKLHKKLDHPEVKGAMASFARAMQVYDALQEAVVVDFEESYEKLATTPNVIYSMYEDVCQWEDISMPFPSMVLPIFNGRVIVVYEINEDEGDAELHPEGWEPDKRYYNVCVMVDMLSPQTFEGINTEQVHAAMGVLGCSWYLSDVSFQVRTDRPDILALDDAYYALEPDKKAEHNDAVALINGTIYALIYLLKHKKLSLPSAAVPTSRNTKRIKRGQAPYSEYKVAMLGDFAERRYYGKEGQGTHASPKMHMRCGHWRRKPFSQEKIWIHSTVVGDPSKGTLIKEYKV